MHEFLAIFESLWFILRNNCNMDGMLDICVTYQVSNPV